MKLIKSEKNNKSKFLLRCKKQWLLVVICLAILVYLFIFKYLPILGWSIGFMDFKIGTGEGRNFNSPWVWFKNFGILFKDEYFWRALKNTVIISLLRLVFSFVASIFTALLINEIIKGWFKRGVQTISYLPHFVSWVVVGSLVRNVLSIDGIINAMLAAFGKQEPFLFMESPGFFYSLTALTYIWKEAGWEAIIFIAVIAGIDPTLYEAAKIDGAGRLKRIIHITIPSIIPTAIILLVMNAGQVLNTGYEQMFVLQTAKTSEVAEVLDLYIYRVAFGGSGRYSLATVASIFKSIVGLVLVFSANKIANIHGKGIKV